MENVTVTMLNRYPTADSTGVTRTLTDVTGFTDNGSGVFTQDGTAGLCFVTYANTNPGYTVVITSVLGTCL